jgi:hypothetical protein
MFVVPETRSVCIVKTTRPAWLRFIGTLCPQMVSELADELSDDVSMFTLPQFANTTSVRYGCVVGAPLPGGAVSAKP